MITRAFKTLIFGRSERDFSGYQAIDGWLSRAEARELFETASKLKKNAVVVEIGSWKGKSTFCIANGLSKGVIHCIDPFNSAGEEGSREIYEQTKGIESLLWQFKNNLKAIPGTVKIKIHKGYSRDFLGAIPSIDFLFIDGDHSIEGCKYDFENYSQYVNVNGFIAFHDYYPDRKDLGPTWVIENIVLNNDCFVFNSQHDSLFVVKKVK